MVKDPNIYDHFGRFLMVRNLMNQVSIDVSSRSTHSY